MRYSELEKRLKASGCYFVRDSKNGHPIWHSPITNKSFRLSNHRSQEVKAGMLASIKRDSGAEL